MKQRTNLLGLGFLAIILSIAPASALTNTEEGNAMGAVNGNQDADQLVTDIETGWNSGDGMTCTAVDNVLEVRASTTMAMDPPDCEIEFEVLLPNGKTLSSFGFELSVRLDDVLKDGEWVCTLVRWRTSQGGGVATDSPVITKGPNEKQILIGGVSPPPSVIPALGEWGMIFLGIGVVLAAVLLIRRRIAAQQTGA